MGRGVQGDEALEEFEGDVRTGVKIYLRYGMFDATGNGMKVLGEPAYQIHSSLSDSESNGICKATLDHASIVANAKGFHLYVYIYIYPRTYFKPQPSSPKLRYLSQKPTLDGTVMQPTARQPGTLYSSDSYNMLHCANPIEGEIQSVRKTKFHIQLSIKSKKKRGKLTPASQPSPYPPPAATL